MNFLDLGEITSPLIICGGAYGNLEALTALETARQAHGIPDDRVIHSGDAAAYCADADAACGFMRTRGWHAIKGNVEEQLAGGADNCGCGFAEGSACDMAAVKWYAHTAATLTPENRRWIAGHPDRLTFTMAGRRFTVVHGSPSQTNRFMFASLPEAEFERELNLADTDAVIAGHTGIPFTKIVGSRLWHNSGALGMPANDGTARVWYAVLEPLGPNVHIRHLPLSFDATAAAAKIRERALPQGYADALETGLWPALDILPLKEQAATGKPLQMDDVVWPNPLARSA